MKVAFNRSGSLRAMEPRMRCSWMTDEKWNQINSFQVIKDNFAFEDTMKIIGYKKTHVYGGYRCILKSFTTGLEYPMFLGDMVEMIMKRDVINATVKSRWTFVRKTNYQGIAILEE